MAITWRIRQFHWLLWKNWKLKSRSKLLLSLEILIPLMCVWLLVLMKTKSSEKTMEVTNYTIHRAEPLIWDWYKKDTVYGYVPSSPEIVEVMEIMKQQISYAIVLEGFPSKKAAMKKAEQSDKIRLIIVLQEEDKLFEVGNLSRKIKYTIMPRPQLSLFNTAKTFPFPPPAIPSCRNVNYGRIQTALGEAILEYWQQQLGRDQGILNRTRPGLNFNFKKQCLPLPPFRDDSMAKILKDWLPQFLITSFILSAIVFTKTIVSEKENRLKEAMKIMGLQTSTYWLSWLFTFGAYFLPVMTILSLLLGWRVDGKDSVLGQTETSVFLAFMLCYGLSLITFCFLISTLVNKANLAAALAGMMHFGMSIQYKRVIKDYTSVSRSVKLMSSLSYNVAMPLGVYIISSSGTAGDEGVNWSNFHLPILPSDTISLLDCMLMLLLDSALHCLLAWYLDQVWPGEHGVARPPLFCFTKAFWFSSKERSSLLGSQQIAPLDRRYFEPDPTGLKPGIEIRNLRKKFKGKVAVQGTTLNMYQGQVTVLLGHNGAGKTVTMGMLTGFISPTSGSAIINGHDIRTDLDAVRSSLGLCPQFNILFDWLTVKEHLDFFSELKGFTGYQRELDVSKYAKEVGLQFKLNDFACKLSGGQKRKLSVAIALVGGSKVVILDEPTAGMDPSARRDTWQVLKRARENRTLLLTTHYMDEADMLGDRIAIMTEGQVKCCGSSMFLKKLYGSGYRLVVNLLPECELDTLMKVVKRHVPDATIESVVQKEVTINLPEQAVKKFPSLFNRLDECKRSMLISGFGISTTSMEEVFMKVNATRESMTRNSHADLMKGVTVQDSGPSIRISVASPGPFSSTSIDVSAESSKRPSNSVHPSQQGQKNNSADDSDESGGSGEEAVDSIPTEKYAESKASTEPPSVLDHKDPARASNDLPLQTIPRAEVEKKTGFAHVRGIIWALVVKKLIYSWRNLAPFAGQILLPCIIVNYMLDFDRSAKEVYKPGFDEPHLNYDLAGFSSPRVFFASDQKQANSMQNQSATYREQFKDMKNVQFERIKLLQNSTVAEYLVERMKQVGPKDVFYHMPIGMEIKSYPNDNYDVIAHYSPIPYHALGISVNYLINTVVQTTLNNSFHIQSALDPLPRSSSTTSTLILMYLVTKSYGTLTGISAAVGMSFATIMMFHFLIHERQVAAKHLQVVSGAGPIVYWASTFLVDYAIYGVCAFLVFEAAINSPHEAYSEQWPVLLLSLVCHGCSSLSFLYAAQFMFSSPASGAVFIVVYNLLSGIIPATVINLMQLLIKVGVKLEDTEDWIESASLLAFPMYNLGACFQNVYTNYENQPLSPGDTNCSFLLCPEYQENYLSMEPPGIGRYLSYMMIQFCIFFGLVFVIDTHVLERIRYIFSCQLTRGVRATMKDFSGEDSDVASERQRILQHPPEYYLRNEPDIDPVTLFNVYKCYGTLVAVDHICIGIAKGECFGLLGQNGAGKTSTFKVLTGDMLVTAGDAYVMGASVIRNISKVQANIGYCPQFDGLILDMTGRETLTMYARLRGLRERDIPDSINTLMKLLLFDDQADELSKIYSGGTKRKLNAAIAMLGDPLVLLLDEPSWGMDPAARRHLWDVFSLKRDQGSTMVLTSHSMEEVEALCTRLAIMVNGRLVCMGNSQHLKNKFGQGYTFIVQVAPLKDGSPAPTEPIVEFVRSGVPGCELFDEHQNYLHFKSPEAPGRLATIFTLLEGCKSSLHIEDYSVQQTTLEQVFLGFTRQQGTPVEDDSRACAALCCCQC